MKKILLLITSVLLICLSYSCKKDEGEQVLTPLRSPSIEVTTGIGSANITWLGVSNAKGFSYSFDNGEDIYTEERIIKITEKSIGEYLFKIKSVAYSESEYTDSEYTETIINITEEEEFYLRAPSLTLSKEPNKIIATWERVENATAYIYTLNDGTETKTEGLSAVLDKLNPGIYTFKLKATAEGTEYNDSPYSKWSITITDPAPAGWFIQDVFLSENENSGANKGNSIFFKWVGNNVETIRFACVETKNIEGLIDENLMSTLLQNDGTIVSNSMIEQANQEGGHTFFYGGANQPLLSETSYTLFTLATHISGEVIFAKQSITTEETKPISENFDLILALTNDPANGILPNNAVVFQMKGYDVTSVKYSFRMSVDYQGENEEALIEFLKDSGLGTNPTQISMINSSYGYTAYYGGANSPLQSGTEYSMIAYVTYKSGDTEFVRADIATQSATSSPKNTPADPTYLKTYLNPIIAKD